MVQVKSQSMLHHGSLGAISKQNKRKLALTLNFYYLAVLFFIVKFVFIITFTAFSFLRVNHGLYLLFEEVMSFLHDTLIFEIWLVFFYLIFFSTTWPMWCNFPSKCLAVIYKARQEPGFPLSHPQPLRSWARGPWRHMQFGGIWQVSVFLCSLSSSISQSWLPS